ncbi:hypothetical protein ABPG72_021271 [Tetrahymena utriculariae]
MNIKQTKKEIANLVANCSIKYLSVMKFFDLMKIQQKHYTDFNYAGNGAFAFVVKANNKKIGQTVALKVVECDSSDIAGMESVQQEYELLQALSSKYIVQVFNCFFLTVEDDSDDESNDEDEEQIVEKQIKKQKSERKVFFVIEQEFCQSNNFEHFYLQRVAQFLEVVSQISNYFQSQLKLKSEQLSQIQKSSIQYQQKKQSQVLELSQHSHNQKHLEKLMKTFNQLKYQPFEADEYETILKILQNNPKYDSNLEFISVGAKGLVLGTFNKAQGRKVALKIQKCQSQHEVVLEVGIMRDCQMPLVLQFYDFFYLSVKSKDDFVVFELEKCSGNLKQFLNRLKKEQILLSENQKMQIAVQIIDVINYLNYNGIVHRDIKLDNILYIDNEPDVPIIKLADFDQSRKLPYQIDWDFGKKEYVKEYTPAQGVCGTLGYIPPEFFDNQQYTFECETFQVGVCLALLDNFDKLEPAILKKGLDYLNGFQIPFETSINFQDEVIKRQGQIYDILLQTVVFKPQQRKPLSQILMNLEKQGYTYYSKIYTSIQSNSNISAEFIEIMLDHQLQVQQSYLQLCIQCFKPHFQFKYFVQETFQYSDDQDVFCHIVVYDLREQKNKLLIIFKSTLSKKFQFFQKVMISAYRSDLVLNLLDQYDLDPKQHFYIFEMEYCYMKLLEFINLYTLDQTIFQPLIQEILGFVYQNIGLILNQRTFLQQAHLLVNRDNNYALSKFFVNLVSQNKIEVKVNLIDTDFELYKNGQFCQYFEDTKSLKQYEQVSLIKEFQTESNKMQVEQKQNIFQEFINGKKLNEMLKELCESVKIKIQMKEFTEMIKSKFQKILNVHPLEIFQIIQQHPLYDIFEIQKLESNLFELKIEKRGQIIRLIANTFFQLSEAEQMIARHHRLINQKQNLSTFIQSDLITVESYFYGTFGGIQQTFNVFAEFCYNLLIQNDISINNIDPSNILIMNKEISLCLLSQGKIDQFQQFSTQNEFYSLFKIDNLSENDFSSQYCQLFEQVFHGIFDRSGYKLKNDNNCIDSLCILAKLFIQKISENQQQIPQQLILNPQFSQAISSQSDSFNQSFGNPEQLDKNLIQAQLENQNEFFNPVKLQNIQPSFLNFSQQNGLNLIANNGLLIEINSFPLNKQLPLNIQLNQNDNFQSSLNQIQPLSMPFNQINSFLPISTDFNLPLGLNSNLKPFGLTQLVNQLQNISTLDESGQFTNNITNQNFNITHLTNSTEQNSGALSKASSLNQQMNLNLSNNTNLIINAVETINQGFNINQIINLNELSQHEHNLITNYQFSILQIFLDNLEMIILIMNENLYYLIGQEPYIIFRHQEFQKLEEIFQSQKDLSNCLDNFGSNYIKKYKQNRHLSMEGKFFQQLKHLQKLNLILHYEDSQFNLQECKKLQQLNLEFFFPWAKSKSYNLKNIIKQINYSNINKIKLIILKHYCSDEGIELNQFYKIKRLVTISLEKRESFQDGDSNGSISSYKVDEELENIQWDDNSF